MSGKRRLLKQLCLLQIAIGILFVDGVVRAQGPAGAGEISDCDVKVFERSNYQGRSGSFRWLAGRLVPPFQVSNASFKIPDGKIVYIRTTFEFSSEAVYTESQPRIDLQNITGIRCDDKASIEVGFYGIQTAIHNNDCRRFYGKVQVMLTEVSPDSEQVQSFMPFGSVSGSPGGPVATVNPNMFTAFNYQHARSLPPEYYRQFIHDLDPYRPNDPEFTISDRIRRGTQPAASSTVFVVGKKAVRDRRLKLLVTSDLGSAHKTCDLCDDFSSFIKMRDPVSTSKDVGRYRKITRSGQAPRWEERVFAFGPYQASGSRDRRALTATGGTFKEFRVYLKLKYSE